MISSAPHGGETVAVIIPCYNEGTTIGKVVRDFRRCLPAAQVYVFDNASSDDTIANALAAGAMVFKEKKRGKGSVVATMLARVRANYYLMVDGDDTYPAERAQALLDPLLAGRADMVVGQRLSEYEQKAFRRLHVLGNRLICKLINLVFASSLTDPMSGYRAFTGEVAEALPVVAWGFDIETEITLQLLHRRFVIEEIPIEYRARPTGSESKLNTFRDGAIIVRKTLGIFKAYKPLTFFGGLALLFALAGLVIGTFPVYEYLEYRYVYSVPKAILAATCMMIATMLVSIGLIIGTINFRIMEMTSVLSKQITRASLRGDDQNGLGL